MVWELSVQVVKSESENEVAQSCPTLCDPIDCSPQMVANRKDLEYFAKSLNVIQKDSVGKETFVEVYKEKNKSNASTYQEIYIHPLSHLTLSTIYGLCNSIL